MAHSQYIGVDACPSGWFSVGFSGNGYYELEAFRQFKDLLAHYEEAKLVLVDMPIGLPEGAEERPGDIEAKDLLAGYRDRTVFRAPTRAATEHLANNPGDRNGAKDIQCKVTGVPANDKGISNTLAIMPKTAEVDSVLSSRATNAVPQVREVHPEILFWAMNDRTPMGRYPKDNKRGIKERISVIERVCPQTREILKASFPKTIEKYLTDGVDVDDVDIDDVLDALVAAVTAFRGHGHLKTLPETPQKDGKGLTMEMVYWIP